MKLSGQGGLMNKENERPFKNYASKSLAITSERAVYYDVACEREELRVSKI